MSRPSRIQTYIFKEFLKRFIPALLVLFFIFVLQTFWVYFDELAGKGLSLKVIFKFFYYFSPNIFLYALPLSVLLAGIMTYGALGEKNELAAIKSSGVSVFLSMRKLIWFSGFLIVFVFVFVNTLQPRGNLQFTRLRLAIARKMPSAVIREGIFSRIGDFSIKVRRKYGNDNRLLEDVIIHQQTGGRPDKVILARKGEFETDNRTGFLKLKLYDGEYFEELTHRQKKPSDRKKFPALYSTFDRYDINIDISGMSSLKETKTDMKLYHMLNMPQLRDYIDSVSAKLKTEKAAFRNELIKRHYAHTPGNNIVPLTEAYARMNLTPRNWISIYNRAHAKATANMNFIKRKSYRFHEKQSFLNKYVFTFHEKIATPFYIFLLLLVGIPLGAMIRKGGFGLPFVLGIIIYAAFYMLHMLGASMAEEGIIPAWLGAWLPVLILLPPVLYMIYAVQTVAEIKWLNRLKSSVEKISRLFKPREIQTDAVFVPLKKWRPLKKDKAVSSYELQEGTLIYRKHEENFDKLFAYLHELVSRTEVPFAAAYWKPPDDFARKNNVLGEVLMIKVRRDGSHRITTNLDVHYRYRDGKLEVVKNIPGRFIHYKEFGTRAV